MQSSIWTMEKSLCGAQHCSGSSFYTNSLLHPVRFEQQTVYAIIRIFTRYI